MRRALIIRSGYDPPPGTHNAAECIAQVLGARGFELVRCEDGAATRSGILAAYDDLIARAKPDDAIVVYYAGHGGLVTNSKYTPGSELPQYVQHICPTDFADTRDDDFRGICALELGLKLVELTASTVNATLILECCFAEAMSRTRRLDPDLDGAPVVRPKLTCVGLTRHLEQVRDRYRALDMPLGAVDPPAVRVAASGQTELARRVSLPSDDKLKSLGVTSSRHDAWIGAMTLGLAEILVEIRDARVPWRSIAPALRARLLVQRPEIEGPIARVPFSLDTVDDAATAVRLDGAGVIVEAGELLGVSVGDVYRVISAGPRPDVPAPQLATVTIDDVSATWARASRVVWTAEPHALPPHPAAIATSRAIRYPVRIAASGDARDAVFDAMRGSPQLRVATEADGADLLGELRVTDDGIELHDPLGALFVPARFPDRLPSAMLDLANLATERRLRGLARNGGVEPSAVTVELERSAPDGEFHPMARHGERMGVGESFVIRLENTTDTQLYANVFNVGVDRQIALLSQAWASGAPLESNKPVYLGDTTSGPLRGFVLSWPDRVSTQQPRRDVVLAIITTEPLDLRALASDGDVQALRTNGTRSAPSGLRGGMRQVGYAMVWRDYLLFPTDE